MTVVLFSSIFAWVTTFPQPPAQNTTQFSANFVLTANQSYVKALQITHLAGPAIPGSTLVYLKSAYHPGQPEFQTPILASTSIPNPLTWNLGQTFNYTFPCPVGACQQPQLPDNITVLLVSNDQVIFSTIIPGTIVNVPPTFVATSVSPASPVVGGAFTISAYVAGNTGGAAPFITLGNIPGLLAHYPGIQRMTFVPAQNKWTFTVNATYTTTNGTFYAFVNITNPEGQSATAGVPVVIVSSGGSSTPGLTVAVVMIPQPPTLPQASAYFAALVTYQGSASNLALSVDFWVNQTPNQADGQPAAFPTQSMPLTGPSGLTISGPSTETVYSSTPATFSGWLLNSSVVVSAYGTVASVGSASGSTSFGTAALITGWVATFPSTGFSHTCTTTCPFLNDTVWSNWTVATTFSGTIWANVTGVNKYTYTIGSTALAAGPNAHTTVSGPGATTRWKPSAAGTYTIQTLITVKVGATVVGYIWDSFKVTVT